MDRLHWKVLTVSLAGVVLAACGSSRNNTSGSSGGSPGVDAGGSAGSGSGGSAGWGGGGSAGAAPVATDAYGGDLAVQGTATGSFHTQKIGDRWWEIDPLGHGIFLTAVSGVDPAWKSYESSGGFLSYDAVYVQSTGGALSANLALAAASSTPNDVVGPSGATLAKVGDTIYLGWRARPYITYFWLGRLGTGGKVRWSYSSSGSSGWALIGGTGKPAAGVALDADGSYDLDVGNDMAPDANGFGVGGSPKADRITWFDMSSTGFPHDFAQVALPGTTGTLYYIKGVVTAGFTTPPVLSQTYERETVADSIAKKYGPGDARSAWAKAMAARLRGWGIVAGGQYSYPYASLAPAPPVGLPVDFTWPLSGTVMGKGEAKNVYSNDQCPPGSGKLGYIGNAADVWEPSYATGMKSAESGWYSGSPIYAEPNEGTTVIPEEGDDMFGFDSMTHDHMGYVVLAANPYFPNGTYAGKAMTYTDPRLYAKYALRDFLRDRYRQAGDPAPAFGADVKVPFYKYTATPTGAELAALDKLNAAWGTSYTTWDTSSGDVLTGTNAWGAGTGFLDENGTHVLRKDSSGSYVCKYTYADSFTDGAHPAVRKDLDDFIALTAKRYGHELEAAMAQQAHGPVFMPLYGGPDYVFSAIGPSVDGFSVDLADPSGLPHLYDLVHKPIIFEDYSVANPDSPAFASGKITSVTYNSAANQTVVAASGFRYVFRSAWYVGFPDAGSAFSSGGACQYTYPWPPVRANAWNSVTLSDDYTKCVKPGMQIQLSNWDGLFSVTTQAQRAQAMIARWSAALNARGSDGTYFVVGFEHWALYDDEVSNWSEIGDYGLLTTQDNAYDGIEARRAAGTDSAGRAIGAEDADYGDLLGPLGSYQRSVYNKIHY